MEQDNNNVFSFFPRHKNQLFLTLFIFLFLLLFILFYTFFYSLFDGSGNKNTASDVKVIPITQISDKSIPQGIPAGLVTEKNTEVVQSYTARVGDKEQFTYQYLSSIPLKDTIKSFENYLNENKWGIFSKQDLGIGFNYVYINNEGSMLTISSVSTDNATKKLVTITLVKKVEN